MSCCLCMAVCIYFVLGHPRERERHVKADDLCRNGARRQDFDACVHPGSYGPQKRNQTLAATIRFNTKFQKCEQMFDYFARSVYFRSTSRSQVCVVLAAVLRLVSKKLELTFPSTKATPLPEKEKPQADLTSKAKETQYSFERSDAIINPCRLTLRRPTSHPASERNVADAGI